MARFVCTILDERFSGLAMYSRAPTVSPVRLRYKWRPWRKSIFVWGVVQPRYEAVGRSFEWIWRVVRVFPDREDALVFLSHMTPAAGSQEAAE